LVGVNEDVAQRLATTIAGEIRFLTLESKREIVRASPVPLQTRLAELQAFQGWMDIAGRIDSPFVTRAQVITQNYICFVYLSEACFAVLRKHAPAGSASKMCAKFLTDNPVRAFRNAIAHSNWHYREDFSGLVYFARKGSQEGEPIARFEVDQSTLGFWQALSRCVAYSMYENLA
jgi:hypothetical protein